MTATIIRSTESYPEEFADGFLLRMLTRGDHCVGFDIVPLLSLKRIAFIGEKGSVEFTATGRFLSLPDALSGLEAAFDAYNGRLLNNPLGVIFDWVIDSFEI